MFVLWLIDTTPPIKSLWSLWLLIPTQDGNTSVTVQLLGRIDRLALAQVLYIVLYKSSLFVAFLFRQVQLEWILRDWTDTAVPKIIQDKSLKVVLFTLNSPSSVSKQTIVLNLRFYTSLSRVLIYNADLCTKGML